MKPRPRLRLVADNPRPRRDSAASFAEMEASLRALERFARARTKEIDRERRKDDAREVEEDWDEWL